MTLGPAARRTPVRRTDVRPRSEWHRCRSSLARTAEWRRAPHEPHPGPMRRRSSCAAREHNLKNVNVELPRDKLVVFTGLSGSGKSSLAFDTIYAEGQRRYVESLVVLRPPVPRADGQARRRRDRGPVAGDLDRPEVGQPQPALDGRHDHRGLRLPAPALRPHRRPALPERRHPAAAPDARSRSSTASCELPEGTRFQVLAPVVRGRKGEYETLLDDLSGQGFVRARVDGEVGRASTSS